MNERANRAIEQAHLEIPIRWYEKPRYFYVASIASTFATFLGYRELVSHPTIWHAVSGALVYISSAVLDTRSTLKVMDVTAEANEKGLRATFKEVNPLYPQGVSREDFKKKSLVMDTAGTFVSAIDLGIAVGVAGSKVGATITNRRNAKRARRIIELVQ